MGAAAQQFPHLGARLPNMYSFLSSRWSWRDNAVCTTQRNVQLYGDASQPKVSVLSTKGICATHYHLSQMCFGARVVARHQYVPCRQRRHCTVKIHNRFHGIKRALFSCTIGDEFPPV